MPRTYVLFRGGGSIVSTNLSAFRIAVTAYLRGGSSAGVYLTDNATPVFVPPVATTLQIAPRPTPELHNHSAPAEQ